MSELFRRWVLSRPWLTFLVLGTGFLIFGALRHSIELIAAGYPSMVACVTLETGE